MSVRVESSLHVLSSMVPILASCCEADEACIRGVSVLNQWDGTCAADSVGSLLYDRFRNDFVSLAAGSNVMWVIPFNLSNPIETPAALKRSDEGAICEAFKRVVREMEGEDKQPLDMEWGAFKKLPVDNNGIQWGASGSQDDSVRNAHTARRPEEGETITTGFAGGTFKSVNEFLPGGEQWGRAVVQTAYGSSSMPDAKHNSDQWQMFGENKYRTAHLKREDVEAHADHTVKLEYEWPGRIQP